MRRGRSSRLWAWRYGALVVDERGDQRSETSMENVKLYLRTVRYMGSLMSSGIDESSIRAIYPVMALAAPSE